MNGATQMSRIHQVVCGGGGDIQDRGDGTKKHPEAWTGARKYLGDGKLLDGTSQGGSGPERLAGWQIMRVNIYPALTLCCVKHLTHIMSLILASPSSTTKEVGAVVSLVYRSGKQSTERLSNLLKVTR